MHDGSKAGASSSSSSLAKWQTYYTSSSSPPWEKTEGLDSYVANLLEQDWLRHPPSSSSSSPIRIIELGSGIGLNSIYLDRLGYHTTAIDFVPEALERGKERGALLVKEQGRGKGPGVKWIQADLFHLFSSSSSLSSASSTIINDKQAVVDTVVEEGSYDLVLDIQCFHVLRTINESAAVNTIHRLLKPGGKALVVTGNDQEPPRVPGPPVLSQEELIRAFVGDTSTSSNSNKKSSSLFRLVSLEQSRFDPTPAYRACPPLCWVALFEKE